jgi:hypothetical protein
MSHSDTEFHFTVVAVNSKGIVILQRQSAYRFRVPKHVRTIQELTSPDDITIYNGLLADRRKSVPFAQPCVVYMGCLTSKD